MCQVANTDQEERKSSPWHTYLLLIRDIERQSEDIFGSCCTSCPMQWPQVALRISASSTHLCKMRPCAGTQMTSEQRTHRAIICGGISAYDVRRMSCASTLPSSAPRSLQSMMS